MIKVTWKGLAALIGLAIVIVSFALRGLEHAND